MNEKLKAGLINTARGKTKAELVFKNAKYLNVFTNRFITADIAIYRGYIAGLGSYDGDEEIDCSGLTIVPGFIDSHIHLESSIVYPPNFAGAVSQHGTTAVITDPHEIANILGCDGIEYMMQLTENLPIDVFFAIPSCVPSSPFDENGARLNSIDIKRYMGNSRVVGLAEMMNFPGTISADSEILNMISSAEISGKIVDGHAPGLGGKDLNAYVVAGAKSDHECTNLSEAIEKLSLGQYIMIRQGTAGRNLDALLPLLNGDTYTRCLFATDDKHPGELITNGHVDYIIKKAIAGGVKPEIAYKVASFNAAEYFGLENRGAIAPGYIADLVLLSDVQNVQINSVYKLGMKVGSNPGSYKIKVKSELENMAKNTMNADKISVQSLQIKRESEKVIGLVEGEIITTDQGEASKIDTADDILKLCVVERHKKTGHIGVCFVKGYGLKSGAIATSIAHDSHNIIAIGASDADIVLAVNGIIDMQGGMIVTNNGKEIEELKLNIAGLMTDEPMENVVKKMDAIKDAAYSLGVNKNIDPFMALSFISLPVIPELRLTTLGVVDVNKFSLV